MRVSVSEGGGAGEREGMEFTDGADGRLPCSDRLVPQIGPNHQVSLPPVKQSPRIASLEYISRDQSFACGLPVPVMYIAARPAHKKWWSSAGQDKSISFASTSNSRTDAERHPALEEQHPKNCFSDAGASKDANSCASSTKETSQAWTREKSSAANRVDASQASPSERESEALVVYDVLSAQSELKSSVTSVARGSIIIKRKKRRRSYWQTLKRKGTKKPEKPRKEKRWAGPLCSEMGEASGPGDGLVGARGSGSGSCSRVLPGGQPDSWSENDAAAFTLALYLFDKDFSAIERFLESKKMKDILHYYYGKFYGTPAFCRWAGSKNTRNRKCVHGPRILQGWRQDELLRRLFPHFPDSFKDGIPEAVKSFNERQLTVEGLALELKEAVGLDLLVRCVGIGVPKRDLTAVHGSQSHHASGLRMEYTAAAPARARAKKCSSLSKEEIMECLAGQTSRIGKFRSQDLFWEAVWPCLLAHGWQSAECAQIPGLLGSSKNPLVFLRPGVANLAFKRSFEKGVHYFDSVSAVLKAVADDPGLMDGSELTSDVIGGGSYNREEEEAEGEGEGEEEGEGEDMQGWSDDMFETLDTHRLRGLKLTKSDAEMKSEAVAFNGAPPSEEHVAQESSESSSVDIDLNRPLSAVSSNPAPQLLEEDGKVVEREEERPIATLTPVTSHRRRRFPIEKIDLNLPPVDLDCDSPPFGSEDDDHALQQEAQTSCPDPVMTHVVPTSVERLSFGVRGSINLNEPLPLYEENIMDEADLGPIRESDLGNRGECAAQGGRALVALPMKMESLASDSVCSEEYGRREQFLHNSPCTCGFDESCVCLLQKRSLEFQQSEEAAKSNSHGKELTSVSNDQVSVCCKLRLRLDGIGTRNIFWYMLKRSLETMNWLDFGSQRKLPCAPRIVTWGQGWSIRISSSMLYFHMEEKSVRHRGCGPPRGRLVEIGNDLDAETCAAENVGKERYTRSTLSNPKPVAGQHGYPRKLRCQLLEEASFLTSYSRSKSQRLPRKYALPNGCVSGTGRFSDSEKGYSDSSSSQGGKISRAAAPLSCHFSRNPASENHFDSSDPPQVGRVESGVGNYGLEGIRDGRNGIENRRKRGSSARSWEATTEEPVRKQSVREELNRAKAVLRTWKVPCPMPPRSSDEPHEYTRQLPRQRSSRNGGRSLSQVLSTKSIQSGFLNFEVGTKRNGVDLQEFEISKKSKVDDATCCHRGHTKTERDLLMTVRNVQDQKQASRLSSREFSPKVKGKRSARLRRRNFSFKQFIFEGQVEDMEEGLLAQPCSCQGPWQPTCHLPSTDKIVRSPKLRQRRSGLPCKPSGVAASNSPPVPGVKVVSSTSKVQAGLRMLVEGEDPAPLNRPTYDVRFTLRRVLSDSAVRSYRQIGRKVPARWNQFPVC